MAGSARRHRILLSCGEPSGDLYAADVARALRERLPEAELFGIGGPCLRAAGVPCWADLDELSVMGFGEVVRHLLRLRRLRDRLAEQAVATGIDLLLAVDYPGFHLALAGRLRRRGVACLHYIPPKTWSWGGWRVRALRRAVDRCAVIFPFEEAYFRQRGIDARFVGHPLLDRLPTADPPATGEREGVLLAPGSRRQELLRIGPVLGDVARRLQESDGFGPLRVSRAATVPEQWLEPLLERCPSLQVVEGPLLPWLRRARIALVTSGTATLEAVLARTPHAIVYRTGWVSYAIARSLVRVRHIGMANIVLGRRVFPEFLQGQLRVQPLTALCARLLEPSAPEAARQKEACDELIRRLRRGGAANGVAALAVEMLGAV